MLSKNKIKFINSLKKKKFRDTHQKFIAEGSKLVSELLKSSFIIDILIATNKWLNSIQNNFPYQVKEIIEVNSDELKKISSLITAQNVIAVVQIPHYTINTDEIINELSLVLDEIKDPGNLGTIIRIADWFGIKNIFCSSDSVDVYNPKVVQATMGAISRVKVHYENLYRFIVRIKKADKTGKAGKFPVYGTFLEGNNIYEHSLSSKGLIILGNESKGISKELIPLISQKLFIPRFFREDKTSESLNVSIAAAIVCSEFRKHRRVCS